MTAKTTSTICDNDLRQHAQTSSTKAIAPDLNGIRVCPPTCAGDLNGDCTVDTVDFLILLANWG